MKLNTGEFYKNTVEALIFSIRMDNFNDHFIWILTCISADICSVPH
jgi:hypothetical protein